MLRQHKLMMYDAIVRTTVTLDADVEQRIREAMRTRGTGFKQTLNEALRKGLADGRATHPRTPFTVESKPMRLRAGLDPARLRELDDDLEIAEFLRKTARFSTTQE